MSLISAKNLVAPIRNKVNLVTIILITLAFAVLRFSGGDVKVISKKNYYRSKGYTRTSTPAKTNDNLFENKQKTNKNSQTLIDIEKELGL